MFANDVESNNAITGLIFVLLNKSPLECNDE